MAHQHQWALLDGYWHKRFFVSIQRGNYKTTKDPLKAYIFSKRDDARRFLKENGLLSQFDVIDFTIWKLKKEMDMEKNGK